MRKLEKLAELASIGGSRRGALFAPLTLSLFDVEAATAAVDCKKDCAAANWLAKAAGWETGNLLRGMKSSDERPPVAELTAVGIQLLMKFC